MAGASFASQALPWVNLGGVFFGFVGSLFLTYDLLGRPGGFLRRMLAVLLPALLSAVIFTVWELVFDKPLGALVRAVPLLNENIDYGNITIDLQHVLNIAAFGVMIGVLTGVFLSRPSQETDVTSSGATTSATLAAEQPASPTTAPSPSSTARAARPFSGASARNGLFLSAVLLAFANVIYVFTGNKLQIADVVQFVVFILAGAIIGGYSRSFVNRVFPNSGRQARLFSFSGLMFGLIVSLILDLVFLFSYYIGNLFNYFGRLNWSGMPPYLWSLTVFAVFDAVFFTAVPGALSGGFSRYIFWRANVMPERQLGAMGISLIIVAFLSQAFAPIAQLAGWLPR